MYYIPRIFIFTIIISSGSLPSHAGYNPELLSIEDVSGKTVVTFTIHELKKNFPQQIYNTGTPWTKTTQKILYQGPLMKDVLEKAGISDNTDIKVIAYNDFISRIYSDEIQKYEPILAIETGCTDNDYNHNTCKKGQKFRPISMLEKGPIFMVWPLKHFPSDYFPARNSIWFFFPVIIQPDQ